MQYCIFLHRGVLFKIELYDAALITKWEIKLYTKISFPN